MKVLLSLAVLVSVSLLVVCSPRQETEELSRQEFYNDGQIVTIDLDQLKPFDGRIYDSIQFASEYVRNKHGLFTMNGWDQIAVDENNNIVIYNVITQTVYLYDKFGNMKTQIGRQGNRRDKGEYSELGSVVMSGHKQEISILDPAGVICKYGYDGKFKGFIDLAEYISGDNIGRVCDNLVQDIVYTGKDGNLLVYYPWWVGEGRSKCLIFDNNNKVIAEKPMNEFFSGNAKSAIARTGFSTYDNCGSACIVNLTDTVYRIQGKEFVPKYVFKQKYSVKNIVDSLGKDVDLFNIGNKPVYEFTLCETEDYLLFKYMSLNIQPYSYRKVNYGLYDKKSKDSYKLDKENFSQHTSDSISVADILFGTNNGKCYHLRVRAKGDDSYNLIRIFPV